MGEIEVLVDAFVDAWDEGRIVFAFVLDVEDEVLP